MSAYGIVCEMSGPASTDQILSLHVGWIGEGDPPYCACGKSLTHYRDWGLFYEAKDLHLAAGKRICVECQAVAQEHDKRMRALQEKP